MTTTLSRKLQLGAFDQSCAGWVNTDITPHLLVARVPGLARILRAARVLDQARWRQHQAGIFRELRWLDVSRRFRFPDASFDAVYCSHILEHLHPDVAEHCLAEVRRVLSPGGVLRLAVPDLDAMVADYDPADPDQFLWGVFQGRGARATSSARHWWHYNAVSLEALLRRLGFSPVYRCQFQEGRCPDLEQIEIRRWSLFMEAIR